MALDSFPAYSPFECGNLGLAYNEIAFRHFLDIERRRAERARRRLLLVLIHLKMSRTVRAPLGTRTSAQIFKVLGGCVREVDFVGWHRQGKVAGAAVGLGSSAPPDVSRVLTERVGNALRTELTNDQMAQLRVRVVRLGGKVSH
jgi:hypothetical protein